MKKIFIYESKSVILENTLYNERMMTALFNKYKDKSEDTIKKINIAALFRTYFGNIHDKDKQYLDTKYEQWYKDTVNTLTKTSIFFDNENAAKKYLDAYINNIGSLGKKAAPFNLKKEKSIEKYLLDVVNNNRWLPDDEYKKANVNFTKDELGDDLIYEDKNIIIVDGSSKGKCIKYGKGETWCISSVSGNRYNLYRYTYKMTFYFVLQKNVESPEHKLIISNMGNGKYTVADQTNADDRAGLHQETWSSIERQIPNLKGKEKYFGYKNITEAEKAFENIIENYRYKSNISLNYIIEDIYNRLPKPHEYSKLDILLGIVIQTEYTDYVFSQKNLEDLPDEYMLELINVPYMFDKNSLLNVLTDKQKILFYKKLKAVDMFDYFLLKLEKRDDKFSEKDLKNLPNEYITALIEIPYMFDKNSLLNVLTDNQRMAYYEKLKASDKFNKFLSSLLTNGGVNNNRDILMDIFKNSDIKIDYFTVHMVEFYYENKNNPEIIEKIINYNRIITNSVIIDTYISKDEKGEFIKLLLDNNVLMIDSDIIETLREKNFTEKIINELLENFINKLASGELTRYLNNEELYTYTDLYNIYIELVKKGVDVKNLKYKKYNLSELNNINRNYIRRIESSKFDKTYIDFLIFLIEKRICNIQVSSFRPLYENADDTKKELLKPLIEVIFKENK